jgi:hypothetical protein
MVAECPGGTFAEKAAAATCSYRLDASPRHKGSSPQWGALAAARIASAAARVD